VGGLGLLLLATAVVATLLVLNVTGGGDRQPRVDGPPPLTPISASPFQNTQPDVAYVGSERCRDCHESQFDTFQLTAHSRSMSVVDPGTEPPDAVFDHALSGRRFHVYRRDGQLFHRESAPQPDGSEHVVADWPLKYLVGSGRFSRTYLVDQEGTLTESPVTWFASLDRWEMSPGYEKKTRPTFDRVILFDCVYCHAGRLDLTGASPERFSIHETAIGCERCHGPGDLHVQRHTSEWQPPAEPASADQRVVGERDGAEPAAGVRAASDGDNTIVHPGRLTRERAEAVCHQCHLQALTRMPLRGRKPGDFRPGLLWQDFYVDFTGSEPDDEMRVVGHVEQLRLSRCYQQSEKLTCITCHDPHDPTPPTERRLQYRMTCLECHEVEACGLPEPQRFEHNGDDCTACHMPSSPTDIPHIAFTHHRIGIHARNARVGDESARAGSQSVQMASSGVHADATPVPQELHPLLPVDQLPELEMDRATGLAYMELFREHKGDLDYQPLRPEAEWRLRKVAARGVLDQPVLYGLAGIAGSAGDYAAARKWAEMAVEVEPPDVATHTAALQLLVDLYIRAGDTTRARQRLVELTTLRRRPRDWFLLGITWQQSGDVEQAIEAFEHARRLDPGETQTYAALVPLYRAVGRDEDALEAAATRRRLEN